MTQKTKLYIEQKKIDWTAVSGLLFFLFILVIDLFAVYISFTSQILVALAVNSFFLGILFIVIAIFICEVEFTKTVKVYVKKESDVT